MASIRTCLLLVVLAACQGGGEPPSDGVRSGSRLRARFLADADGARQFETFYDAELSIDCTFQGEPPRCLPEVAHVRSYRDLGCTMPLFGRGVSDSECATLPDHFGIALAGECPDDADGFQRIWRRGERVTPDEIYILEAGTCVSQAPRLDYEYYAADLELPVEGFVTATYEVSGEGRVRDIVLVGEDGSRQPSGFHDEDLDAECTYDELLGRCVPEFIPQSSWRDELCSSPIAEAIPSPCTSVPRFIGRYSPEGDDTYSLALFERGPEFTPSLVWYGAEERSCGFWLADATFKYYLAGDDVVGELAELHPVAGDDRRLQAHYLTDDEGSQLRVAGLHDRDGKFDCSPVQTGPDRWHCLPDFGVTTTRLFADPLCEQEVAVFERSASETRKSVRGIVWQPAGEDGCESHALVHQQGPEIASGNLYVPRLLGCQRLTWNPAELQRFAVGAEVRLDEYVRMTRVTE